MSQAGSGDAPAPEPDPAYPRLRPLHLEPLREALDTPALGAEAGDPPTWTALLEGLRRDPPQASLLLRVLAWGLAEADLIWWACLGARFEETLSGRRTTSRALVMAERWLREPDEAIRYETMRLAQAEPKPTAGTLAGFAAFTAGPSLAAADAPPQPPPPGLARATASGALVAAAVAPAMEATGRGFEIVNHIGLEIAAGRDGRAAARRALGALEAQPRGAMAS